MHTLALIYSNFHGQATPVYIHTHKKRICQATTQHTDTKRYKHKTKTRSLYLGKIMLVDPADRTVSSSESSPHLESESVALQPLSLASDNRP